MKLFSNLLRIISAAAVLFPLVARAQEAGALSSLQHMYRSALVKIDSSYEDRHAKYSAQYVEKLKQYQKSAQKDGDLEALLELKKEMRRFAETQSIPVNIGADDQDRVASLQQAFRGVLTKARREQLSRHTALLSKYLGRLGELEKQFVKQGNIEAAVEVNREFKERKGEYDRLQTEWATLQPKKPKPDPGMAKPGIPAELRRGIMRGKTYEDATVHWLMSDVMDIYHNGKPLRDYDPSFKTRGDEARMQQAFTATIDLKPGDVFTIGGRKGDWHGGTIIVTDKNGKMVWCSNEDDWKVYEPESEEGWYLPEVALGSKQRPVKEARSYGYQANMRNTFKGKPIPIWGDPKDRFVYMVGIYR